jgi:hypothetical protein
MKYKLHYDKLINLYGSVKKPTDYYTERHHIIPKCLGGNNDSDNLVYLSGKAHFIAHLLLTKLYPDNNGLLLAAVFLSKGKEYTSRSYSTLRKAFANTRKDQGKIDGKPVITPKGKFPSIYAAAKAHGLSRSRMVKKITSTSFTCKFYHFEGEEKKTKARTGHGLHLAKEVTTPLGSFLSCREAATAHNIHHSVVARRAKNPNRLDYWYT